MIRFIFWLQLITFSCRDYHWPRSLQRELINLSISVHNFSSALTSSDFKTELTISAVHLWYAMHFGKLVYLCEWKRTNLMDINLMSLSLMSLLLSSSNSTIKLIATTYSYMNWTGQNENITYQNRTEIGFLRNYRTKKRPPKMLVH